MSIDLAAIRARADAATPGPIDYTEQDIKWLREQVRRGNRTLVLYLHEAESILAEIDRLRALVGPEASPATGEVTR